MWSPGLPTTPTDQPRLPPTELRPEASEFPYGKILRVLNSEEAKSLITPE